MKTIALRFSDRFAPPSGTIAEHSRLIQEKGFVWYGKLGASVADRICNEILEGKEPRVLLIHSGKTSRYWAYIDKISKQIPPRDSIPEYYRDQAGLFKTWFRVKKFEKADKNVMADCIVVSSGSPLSIVSRHSMSPYFIISLIDGDDKQHE